MNIKNIENILRINALKPPKLLWVRNNFLDYKFYFFYLIWFDNILKVYPRPYFSKLETSPKPKI